MKAKALEVDFVLELYAEKTAGGGEDAYLHLRDDRALLVSVLDGCGGSGARRYARLQDHTGAYIASRVVAGAVCDWFKAGDALRGEGEREALLKDRIKQYLGMCQDAASGTSVVRGTLAKDLPTTCAIVTAVSSRDGIELRSLWAGDSRCYLLDATGLQQLTVDDVTNPDEFDNLRDDGALTNVISASTNFTLHARSTTHPGPCLALCATDGCFSYLSTPMEFEHLLLHTLGGAQTPAAWEEALRAELLPHAGDDATLCGVSMGFGSFSQLREALLPRREELERTYISRLSSEDEAGRRALWERYRDGYHRP